MSANLWRSIPATWQDGLSSIKPELDQIDHLLDQEFDSGLQVVPEIGKLFAALSLPPSDVSVVLLGQDPYPTPSHAIGLAFAVPVGTQPIPGSLRNMFKEVETDTGTASTADSSLSRWMDQGVLLLNTSLTTTSGVRAAHVNWPWEPVVRAIIEQVVRENPKVVGLLLGNHAKRFAEHFASQSTVLAAHPSPLSANRGFIGSKPFTRVNSILKANNKAEIIW
jgi:uracil-DNA glycosylase